MWGSLAWLKFRQIRVLSKFIAKHHTRQTVLDGPYVSRKRSCTPRSCSVLNPLPKSKTRFNVRFLTSFIRLTCCTRGLENTMSSPHCFGRNRDVLPTSLWSRSARVRSPLTRWRPGVQPGSTLQENENVRGRIDVHYIARRNAKTKGRPRPRSELFSPPRAELCNQSLTDNSRSKLDTIV